MVRERLRKETPGLNRLNSSVSILSSQDNLPIKKVVLLDLCRDSETCHMVWSDLF